jgi:hypothetical protein
MAERVAAVAREVVVIITNLSRLHEPVATGFAASAASAASAADDSAVGVDDDGALEIDDRITVRTRVRR